MTVDLEGLGSAGFQDFAASLAVAVLGHEVAVMGAGRDGGRDLYADGSLLCPGEGGSTVLAGYTVLQVKHKAELAARPQDNAAWLWGQVRKELDSWCGGDEGRERPPDHLLFITNVPLSPVPTSGGHDLVRAALREYGEALADSSRDLGDGWQRKGRLARFSHIRSVLFWDRNQIEALLAGQPGVRRAFKALLTVPDVLADLQQLSDRLPAAELERGLRLHARSALLSDGRLNFAEAGGDNSYLQVHDVAVDLPVLTPPSPDRPAHRGSLVDTVLDATDRVLKPSVTITAGPRHLILTGSPGNGKTTVSRLLTQAYRAALLWRADNLGADHRTVVGGTAAALERLGRSLPRHPRWPIRIDLAEYAEERGHLIDDTLIRWISEKVSAASDVGTVGARAIKQWQAEWPWFVVLDGLDEVTEPSIRATVIDRVVGFVNDADGDDCDVFVLLTTRPTGYTEDISPAHFRTLALADLAPHEALAYGISVTGVRLRDDDERRQLVIRRLHEAAESEATRSLLRTPLQVLILTIIIDASAGNLPPDRFGLFWGYYDTVFRRERNKRTSLRGLLRDHGPQITKMHERIGHELQCRSESGDRSYAALTEAELRRVARDVLTAAGHPTDSAGDDLLDRILTAATHRLVLIVPRGPHGFGFDVRPLQELNAARHLTNSDADEMDRALRATAASPHWRNTWIFAAGRIFADAFDHQLDRLMQLVEDIDKDAAHRLGGVVPVGQRLALDLLDDGMARSWPGHQQRLLTAGLEVLHEPHPRDLMDTTRTLLRYADNGPSQRAAVADGLRELLSGPTATRANVQHLQLVLLPAAEQQLRVNPSTRGLDAVRRDPAMRGTTDPVADWPAFDVAVAAMSVEDRPALLEVVELLRQPDRLGDELAQTAVQVALLEQETARGLEIALQHVALATPQLYTALRDGVLPAVYREPT